MSAVAIMHAGTLRLVESSRYDASEIFEAPTAAWRDANPHAQI
ncbi:MULTISPECIES: hypothetical protein [unclassified Pseudoxanthomonas]